MDFSSGVRAILSMFSNDSFRRNCSSFWYFGLSVVWNEWSSFRFGNSPSMSSSFTTKVAATKSVFSLSLTFVMASFKSSKISGWGSVSSVNESVTFVIKRAFVIFSGLSLMFLLLLMVFMSVIMRVFGP